MHFRFRWKQAGGHVHVRVFVGKERPLTHGLAGNLTFETYEWLIFRKHIERSAGVDAAFEVVPESEDLP